MKNGQKRATEEPLNRCLNERPGEESTTETGSSPVHPAIRKPFPRGKWKTLIGRRFHDTERRRATKEPPGIERALNPQFSDGRYPAPIALTGSEVSLH